jgi:hypothetical protein
MGGKKFEEVLKRREQDKRGTLWETENPHDDLQSYDMETYDQNIQVAQQQSGTPEPTTSHDDVIQEFPVDAQQHTATVTLEELLTEEDWELTGIPVFA